MTRVPEGWHTITPRVFTEDPAGLVAFLQETFGATGDYRDGVPAEIQVGDSWMLVSDASARPPMGAFLYVYVDDADETYRRAVKGGAVSLEEPKDLPYGDRRCMVSDRWGNTWQIATRRT